MLNKIIFTVLAVIAIFATALIQGQWTDRWNSTSSEKLQQFVEGFERIPTRIEFAGQVWHGYEAEEDPKRKARLLQQAGANDIRTVSYREAETGDVVTVMLVCGPSRHVSAHTPNHCFVGQGFTMSQPITKFRIGEGEFYTAKFQKPGDYRRVFWGWNPDGKFEVPKGRPPVDARKVYGGRLPLNKIYLIHQIPAEGQDPEESLCVEFGPAFMSEFNRVVFGTGKDADVSPVDAG